MIFAGVKLWLYNAFLLLSSPFLLAKKAIKFGRRGHKHEWDFARWNAPEPLGSGGKRMVFVALSWGEMTILDQLSRRIEAKCPEISVVWSIRDRAAQELARSNFPGREIVPMPFDFALPTRNWLKAIDPDVLVIVEKFWWPNLVWGAKLRGAKVVLVNGRSRGREKARYKWMSGFQRWVLSAFDLLLFESQSQIERVRDVLPRGAAIHATGNVKFGFEAAPQPPETQSLEKWLQTGDKPLFFAGSTAPIDEKWALDAFEKVRLEIPCRLVIAPRRVERVAEVASQIEKRGLRVSRRSAPTFHHDVLLLDTLGELAYCYQFGMAAYVGGSVEGRGHNIIEPLAWGIPVSYGPNRGDFESAQRAAEEAEVGFRLHNREELAAFWQRALLDDEFRREAREKSADLLRRQKGALEKTVASLEAFLEPSKP